MHFVEAVVMGLFTQRMIGAFFTLLAVNVVIKLLRIRAHRRAYRAIGRDRIDGGNPGRPQSTQRYLDWSRDISERAQRGSNGPWGARQ